MWIIKKYISYLNLFIVQDWQYETDEVNKVYAMKSETAGIKVSLVETLDNFLFSVHIY